MDQLNLAKFRTLNELKRFTETLFKEYVTTKDKLKEVRDKLSHTEELLKNVPVDKIERKSMEEELLLREIRVIDQLSQDSSHGLNMEEVKQLKLLIDALVSIRRKEPEQKTKKKNTLKGKTPAELLSIVRNENDRTSGE